MTKEQFLVWESQSRDVVVLKKMYADITDDMPSGLLLSQIIYWHLPGSNCDTKLRVQKDGELWLVKSYNDWWNECRIKRKQAIRIIANLVADGIIVTSLHKFGVSDTPTLHLRINWPVLLKKLEEYDEKPNVSEGQMESAQEEYDEKPNVSEGQMGFAQTGKWGLPKRANGEVPKRVNGKVPKRVNPLTETTSTKTTIQNTPLPPKGGCARVASEASLFAEGGEVARNDTEPTSRKDTEPTSRKDTEPTSRNDTEPTSRKDTEPTSRKEEAIVARYNEIADNMKFPRCTLLNPSRRRHLAARIKDHPDKADWQTMFSALALSSELQGQSWFRGLDWIVSSDDHFMKVSARWLKWKLEERAANVKQPRTWAPHEEDGFISRMHDTTAVVQTTKLER